MSILLTEVSLSDDIFRFITEGKAITHGINPYSTSVNDFPLEIKDQYTSLVNNADKTSPYPPLALLFFALLYSISPTPFIYRLSFSIGFLISIIICYYILTPENRWRLVIYAWNPILHLETANGSHYDAIVVLFVAIAIWGLNSERLFIAGGSFLLAFLFKYYPLFLVILFWKQLGKKGLIVFLGGLGFYGLYILIVPQALNGLLTFGVEAYFNASVLSLVVRLTQDYVISKMILGVMYLLILVILAFRGNEERLTSPSMGLIAIGLFLLFLPVFHPWYLFWIFPFVIMTDKLNYSWIVLSGTLILSYYFFVTSKMWISFGIIQLIEYLPFYIALVLENKAFITRKYIRKRLLI
jgi:hypothetical protein